MTRYFFIRKHVWLPTWQFLIFILLIIVVTGYFLLINVAGYLAMQSPVKSDYLVIEGWLDKKSLSFALKEYHLTGYEFIITTGGPDKTSAKPMSHAQISAQTLIDSGIPPHKIIIAEAPESAQNRTFLSAVMVREKLKQLSIPFRNFNVYSRGVHARRSHYLYQSALREHNIQIGIISSDPVSYELSSWWRTSEGAKTVLTELIAWIWTKMLFTPPEVGSHQELWGISR